MTGARLRKTLLAKRVKDDYESGKLDWWSAPEWVIKMNWTLDKVMLNEVRYLIEWIESGREL